MNSDPTFMYINIAIYLIVIIAAVYSVNRMKKKLDEMEEQLDDAYKNVSKLSLNNDAYEQALEACNEKVLKLGESNLPKPLTPVEKSNLQANMLKQFPSQYINDKGKPINLRITKNAKEHIVVRFVLMFENALKTRA